MNSFFGLYVGSAYDMISFYFMSSLLKYLKPYRIKDYDFRLTAPLCSLRKVVKRYVAYAFCLQGRAWFMDWQRLEIWIQQSMQNILKPDSSIFSRLHSTRCGTLGLRAVNVTWRSQSLGGSMWFQWYRIKSDSAVLSCFW